MIGKSGQCPILLAMIAQVRRPARIAVPTIFVLGLISWPNYVHSQSFAVVDLVISGATKKKDLEFSGLSQVNLLKRKGTVRVRRTDGVDCKGNVILSASYQKGSGDIECKDGITATFDFNIQGIRPIKGSGDGIASDGRTFYVNIKQQLK
jgi:hypothetical protein